MKNIEKMGDAMNRLKKIGDAKCILKEEGYFVDNLWTTFDVQSSVECTDDEAMDILYHAMTNESVMEHIWFAIEDYALINKFKLKVERNEEGDEFVAGCSGCGEDVNELDINGFCKKCNN